MVVPTITHETWKKVDAYTVIALASDNIGPHDMTFGDRLELLLDVDPVERLEDMEPKEYQYSHPVFEEGVAVRYNLSGRDDPHRPRVPDETADRLAEWVDDYSPISGDSLGFEKQVLVLLESLEKYYRVLDCRIRASATGDDTVSQQT